MAAKFLPNQHNLSEDDTLKAKRDSQQEVMLLPRHPNAVRDELLMMIAAGQPNHQVGNASDKLRRNQFVHIVPPPSSLTDGEDDDSSTTSSKLHSMDDYSTSSSNAEDYDDDYATDEEEEDRLVKRLVEYAFARNKRPLQYSIQEIAAQSLVKKPRTDGAGFKQCVPTSATPAPTPAEVASEVVQSYVRRMSVSASAPNLLRKASEAFTTASADSANDESKRSSFRTAVSPQDYLRSMFDKAGMTFQTKSALQVPDYFVKCSGEYDMALVQAVRTQDLDALAALHSQGRNLQCANKFGESTVHTASRHGAASVLEFLMECGVSIKVCCDSGRTPLHDACWTVSPPQMGVVDVLLEACPDLLYLCDKRGLAPLAYVPREHWQAWCNYLEEKGLERLAAKDVFK